MVLPKYCPDGESLTWYLTKEYMFVWADLIPTKTFQCLITVKMSLYVAVVPGSVIILECSFELFQKYASRKINWAHAQAYASLVLGNLSFKGLEKSLLGIFAIQPPAVTDVSLQHLEIRALFCSRTSKQWPGLAHSLNCMFLWGKTKKPLSLCI